MTTPPGRPPRRAAIPPARSVVSAAAEAARQAEQEADAAAAPDIVSVGARGADLVEEQPAADDRSNARQARQRLSSGRVSYAGRAVTIYFPSGEDKDRVAAAFAALGGREGYTSASEWMADCILGRVDEWEGEHNHGRPFTEVLTARRERRSARRQSGG